MTERPRTQTGNARGGAQRRRATTARGNNRGRRRPAGRTNNQDARAERVEHKGPKRPISEVAAFGELGLSDTILEAVAEMGYSEPTEIQKQAIPAVLNGSDVMGAAQTGTGKTCAFMLPLLDRIAPIEESSATRILVITPTRELAAQIAEVAETASVSTHHRVLTIVGGVSYEGQRSGLKAGTDVLVGTPGRLIDLMREGTLDLSCVEALVLDEADRMLDMGFLPQVKEIVAKVPKERQTLLFSATLSEDVLKNMGDLVTEPVRVEVAPKGTAAETITQYALGVSHGAKKRILIDVLKREGADRVIVFCRGKHRADHMSRTLQKKGFSSAPIHGDRTQNQRARALERFSKGEVGVLVATDVLARGIDVGGVAYVVNLDVPNEAEAYIHRIGRTGRAGEEGWALTFVTEQEYDDLRAIESLMGKVIDTYPHAEGLDVGEGAAVLDPERGLPQKKGGARSSSKRRRSKGAKQASQAGTDAIREPKTDQQKSAVTDEVSAEASAKAEGPSRQSNGTARGQRPEGRERRDQRRRAGGSQQFRQKSETGGAASQGKPPRSSGARRRRGTASSAAPRVQGGPSNKARGNSNAGGGNGHRRRRPGDRGGSARRSD